MARGVRILIVVSVVVGILVILALAALTVVNRRAEEQIARTIDESLTASGLAPLVSYGAVDVQAARGTIRLRNVVVSGPPGAPSLSVDQVSITTPPTEVVGMMADPQAGTISRGTVQLIGLTLDGGTDLFDEFSLDSARLSIRGTFPPPVATPEGFLAGLERATLELEGARITPGAELPVSLAPSVRAVTPADGAVRLDRFTTDVRIEGTTLDVERFALDSPQLDAEGEATVSVRPGFVPQPLEARISVASIDPALRTLLDDAVAAQLDDGTTIPEEPPFTLRYGIGSGGEPQIRLE